MVPHNDTDRAHIATFILQVAQLGLLLYLARVFLIEQSYGFAEALPIIFVGFIVHALLPPAWRGPFFVVLFPVSAVAFLGLIAATALVSISVFLFLLCHLPISVLARAGMLAAVALGLAALRVGMIDTTIPSIQVYFQTQTLPILSAIFMFRTAIYLYDLRHEKGHVPLWQRLGYFFVFPNIWFPLFPVIDYQTYKRTYFDRPSQEIYQKGLDFIFRGITHLLLYRLVYHYMVPDPLEIQNLLGVGQYALSSFLLYLRVSGLFHLITGVMCLFGFNLPETHHRYYLAESFTDFWRRINIYWKDFMMKMFYFPIYMSLRRWGVTLALVLATLITFFITWLLHSYQWFWLRGTFTLHPQDMIFWGILALLVTANSLYEEKYGRKRKSLAGQADISVPDALARSVRTVAVFLVVCALWSFWTSSSMDQWLSVMSVIGTASPVEIAGVVILLLLAIAGGVLLQLAGNRGGLKRGIRPMPLHGRAAWIGAASIFLLVVANPAVDSVLGPGAERIVATVTGDQLNTRDQQQLVKGYYEGLLGTESSGAMVWTVRLEEPDTWDWNGDPAADDFGVETNDIRGNVLKPFIDAVHKGQEFRTNRWGMRDRDYDRTKPRGTYRIAMLGSSHTVGAGVVVEQTFPSLIEEELNNGDFQSAYKGLELLNFANAGDSILRRLARFQKEVLPFNVDAVIDMSITGERHLAVRQLRSAVKDGTTDIDPFLLDVIKRAGITPDLSSDEIERRLGPYGDEVISWAYQELSRAVAQKGLKALVVVLPRLDDTAAVYKDEWQRLSAIAQQAELPVIGIGDVYGSINKRSSLKLASWDWHPNAKGHALLADRLYQELLALQFIPVDTGGAGQRVSAIKQNPPIDRTPQ